MTRWWIGLLAGLLLAGACSAGELLEDPDFSRGLRLLRPEPALLGAAPKPVPQGVLQPAGADAPPVWHLAQWGSAASLEGVAPTRLSETGGSWELLWRDNGTVRRLKRVRLFSGGLSLAVDGLAEARARGHSARDDLYLTRGEPWPHLLVSQYLATRPLTHYRRLQLRFRVRLNESVRQTAPGYQPAQHAGRFVMAMTLKNLFTGDYLWLNLPVYDDRWPMSDFGCRKCLTNDKGRRRCRAPASLNAPGRWQCPLDRVEHADSGEALGTQRMLFRVPSRAFLTAPLEPGQWRTASVDLLPWLHAALEAASEQGLPGFRDEPHDFRLALFTLGWEVSGLNRVSLSLRDLSLTAELRPWWAR